ncbi:MAG TPA: MBL fold metallo-hydrolase, partial [Sphingomonas sp.]|nr:MBL fold metallo-hydrolase [Sphingomonas sp.]
MMELVPVPALSDNYIWLLHDPGSGETVAVDPSEAEPARAEAERRGWRITQVWNTHWHADHVGGDAGIKAATGAIVTGPAEATKLAALDRVVGEGDTLRIGKQEAHVIAVGAHTAGHIAIHLPDAGIAFT